jgi:hypothetical protein
MMEPNDPGDFGRPLLNITKKLRTQNLWLKIAVSALSVIALAYYIRRRKRKKLEYPLSKEKQENSSNSILM